MFTWVCPNCGYQRKRKTKPPLCKISIQIICPDCDYPELIDQEFLSIVGNSDSYKLKRRSNRKRPKRKVNAGHIQQDKSG